MGTVNITTPSDGETIDAADVATPLNTIVNEINGNLDNANIASSAAISGSKLADDSVTPAKISGRHYQLDNSGSKSSVTDANIIYQSGWDQAQGDNTAQLDFTITFPEAFTTVLGVIAAPLGTKSSSAAANIGEFTAGSLSGTTCISSNITTTGFDIDMNRESGNFSSATYYACSWIAWGV